MRLPNLERAFIDIRKLTEYLLAPDHPEGGPKAAFFIAFGFSADRPLELADVLHLHAQQDVSASIETEFGVKYVIEAPINGPDGRKVLARSVWVVLAGENIVRFVTAYPLEVL